MDTRPMPSTLRRYAHECGADPGLYSWVYLAYCLARQVCPTPGGHTGLIRWLKERNEEYRRDGAGGDRQEWLVRRAEQLAS